MNSGSRRGCGCKSILLLGIFLFVGFQVITFLRYKKRMEENPPVLAPGEAEFERAEKTIGRNAGKATFGNTTEAQLMARQFSKQMGVLRQELFTAAEKSDFSLTDGVFLSHCHLLEDKCVFLVHVPQLRKFTDDAQDGLADLAWLCANQILLESGYPESTELAVGVKGIVNYGGILIGTLGGGDDPMASVTRRTEGFSDRRLFHRFYVEGSGDSIDTSAEAEMPEPDDSSKPADEPAPLSPNNPPDPAKADEPLPEPETEAEAAR